MKLTDKTAIVTGAARGIGRAITLGFVRAGATVVACDVRGGADVDSLMREAGEAVLFHEADISNLHAHERIVRHAMDKFGRLDVLVNNAGIEIRQPFLEATPDAWDSQIAVNLRGAYFLAQAAARQMIEQNTVGKIINITSIHDTVALPNASIYSITKGGMMMLTRSLALELAAHRINVNAVAPGAILTDMNREVLSKPGYHELVTANIPLRRIGSPADVVGAAVFLASADSDYVTGSTIYVDGGILLR